MNIFTIKSAVSAKVLALIALTSLFLSAFPAGVLPAFAATNLLSPTSFTLQQGSNYVSISIDASAHENLVFSFNYNAQALDASPVDSVTYGWRANGGSNNDLGVITGLSGNDPLEIDMVTKSLPSGAQISNLEVYAIIVANTPAASDQVFLTNITVSGDSIVSPACSPQTNVPGPTNIQNTTTNDYFDTVNDALADCDTVDGQTIALLGNISTAEQITIDRPITLAGNGFTVSPTFARTGNSNNATIGVIDTSNVTIDDVTINGAGGTNLHGINIYESTTVVLTDVTINNANRSGVVVNGSVVTATNLVTTGSPWHAVNAAPGSGVTDPTVFTVNNTSNHGEASPTPHIYIDDVSKNVTINDTNNQYEIVYEGPNPQNQTLTARSYRLKTTPTTPVSDTKVDICHASGNSGNYQKLNVDKSSVNQNDSNGHGGHDDDIIPPFDNFAGRNWDTAGQAIWNNNCAPVVTVTPVCSLVITSDEVDFVEEKNTLANILTAPFHPSWITGLASSVAQWVWGDTTVTDPTGAETQTFVKTFNWTGGTPSSATLRIASDNSHTITLGTFSGGDAGGHNFSAEKSYNVLAGIVSGLNTLEIEVENFPMNGGTQATNPAGLIYELTIEGEGTDCGVVVPIEPTATVTMCKVDSSGNNLEGWQLALVGEKVGEKAVAATGVTQSIAGVPAGEYVVKASGSYKYRNPNYQADAAFSERAVGDAGFASLPYQPWQDSAVYAPNNYLGLQINSALLWGSVYNPAHIYYAPLSLVATDDVDFLITDSPAPSAYTDNVGTILAEVFEGYTGVTNANGCVVFDDVPYGTYNVEELMQLDWENVSGLGAVVVDGASETFTVTNRDTTLPLQCVPKPDGAWAFTASVVSVGALKSGNPITNPARTNINATVGVSDWSVGGGTGFYSIGFGGSIVVAFEDKASNVAGNDFFIHEATNGSHPLETASVEVSQDNTNWVPLGVATNGTNGKVSGFDIASTGLSWVKYVRITDTTDASLHANDADGFDIDAVRATATICEADLEPFATGTLEITKYACPANTDVVRSENGINGDVPLGCIPQSGASFAYVHGTQTDANAPYPELDAVVIALGETVAGSLVVPNLLASGRYLIVETDEAGNKLPADAILGLYCEGDGDVSNTNDNQELTFIEPGETTKCIAYNKLETIPQCTLTLESDDNTVVVTNNNYATSTYSGHPSWTASIPGATWIWDTFYAEDTDENVTRTFEETFTADNPLSAKLDIAADNTYKLFINGELVLDRDNENNYGDHTTLKGVDVLGYLNATGTNTMRVEVTNTGVDGSNQFNNPAGLLYKLVVIGSDNCVVTTEPSEDVVIPDDDVATTTPTTTPTTTEPVVTVPTTTPTTSEPTIIPTTFSSRSSGGNRARVLLPAPVGQVLGATDMQCSVYLTEYMRMGATASSTQVMKLQIFLNAIGLAVPITSVFDAATDEAVRSFQLRHQADVLTPWYVSGIVPHNNPTGWVYQLTRWKINNIVCPGSEAYPALI